MSPRFPHKLECYRAAVQHPQAEVAFLLRAHAHYARRPRAVATRLREDFAGTAAVAAAFVALDDNHRALAVEAHAPTLRWAQRQARRQLGSRAGDLHFVLGGVLQVRPPRVPKVDIVAALNFSTFIYHSRDELRSYFRAARQSLRPGGILVIDAYGGPGAMRVGVQRRRVTWGEHGGLWGTGRSLAAPADDVDAPVGRAAVVCRPLTRPSLPFGPPSPARGEGLEYLWEQRSCDAVTARVDCRIHLALPGGRVIRNAFRYDWRLWTLPELLELMREAGFVKAQAWCDRFDSKRGCSDGVYRPVRAMPAREDWVAYVMGAR